MIAKRIEYSGHAIDRMAQRGITRQEVRWLLAKGERSKARTLGGEQRWQCRGYLGKHEAAVYFVENAERYVIVSVEWIGDTGDETYD